MEPREIAERLWREFAALVEQPGQPLCPFCGLRHRPSGAHPFCDMAAQFNSWWRRRLLP